MIKIESEMASTHDCCVICGKYRDDKLALFTEQTLEKCKSVLSVRNAHNLKYRGLCLPTAVDEISGYHSGCYRNFTAVAKKYFDQSPSILLGNSPEEIPNHGQEPSASSLRQIPMEPSQDVSNNSSTQGTSKVSIFCGNERKTVKRKLQKLCIGKKDSLHTIKKYASEIHDLEMLKKIEGCETSNEVPYHCTCRYAYEYKSSVQNRQKTTWHTSREQHKQAFDKLADYLKNEIVEGRRSIFFSSLCSVYTEIFSQISGDNVETGSDLSFSEQHLEKKIKSKFCNQVKIVIMHHRKIVVSAEGIDNHIDESIFKSLEEEDVLQRAALILKRDLSSTVKDELPENLPFKDDVLKGERSTPQSLEKFYSTVMGGLDCRRRNNPVHLRKVTSLCQDLIYAVSGGKMKTSIHRGMKKKLNIRKL